MSHRTNKERIIHHLFRKKNEISKIPLNRKMSKNIRRIEKSFHRSLDTGTLRSRVENVDQDRFIGFRND